MFASAKEKGQKVASTASSPLECLSRVYFSRYPANGEFARRLTVSVSRNSVYWLYPILPFGIITCTFSDNLSRNSCIWEGRRTRLLRSSFEQPRSRQTGQPAFSYKHNNNFMRKQGMSRASPINISWFISSPFFVSGVTKMQRLETKWSTHLLKTPSKSPSPVYHWNSKQTMRAIRITKL